MNIVRSIKNVLGVVVLASTAQSLLAQSTFAPVAEAVTVPRAPGHLAGTLLVPRTSTPVPVVLLIAGSGATDRDGNGPGYAPGTLRQLAESLAVRNVATLRFDKRYLGGSLSASVPEVQLTFELLAEDVAAWVHSLAADRRFTRVIVAGHSEGALLGLLTMRQSPGAAYVSLAGFARPAYEGLHDQLAAALPAPLLTQSDSILERLKRGQRTDSVPPGLASVFRPSVQPYMISWFKHWGREEIARLTKPCLIVQGDRDLQVAPTEADLLLEANPRCAVLRIADMNHVLKETTAGDPSGQLPTYRAPDPRLAPRLVDAIAAFAKAGAP